MERENVHFQQSHSGADTRAPGPQTTPSGAFIYIPYTKDESDFSHLSKGGTGSLEFKENEKEKDGMCTDWR